MQTDDLSNIIQTTYKNRDILPNMGKLWRAVYDKHFNMDAFEQNINKIFFAPQEKMRMIMNNYLSHDVPYFEMMTEKFQKFIDLLYII